MDKTPQGEVLYSGDAGYASVRHAMHNGRNGALLYYENPDSRKLHAVDMQGMRELETAVDSVISTHELKFCVFYGAFDPVHAGADITQFAGDPDIPAIKAHLNRGTQLDARIKTELWPRMRTVAIISGDRYGGSVEWPLFAQYAVTASSARLQFSEVHLGIVPGWNGVLNVLLRSNPTNALYMGATGNALDAGQLLNIGLAQHVVRLPVNPDRRGVPPEKWPQVWAEYAEYCQVMLLKAALELAVMGSMETPPNSYAIATPDMLEDELKRRLNPSRYRELRYSIKAMMDSLGENPDKDDMKALSKKVARELAALGKPLAPAAVTGIREYIDKWGVLERDELLARFAEAAQEEADLCTTLMSTEHRRRGVDAILTSDPVKKVPVFD